MMVRIKISRRMFAIISILVMVSALGLGPVRLAYAFHFPWDQGHDTFVPNPPNDDDNPPDNDDGDDDGDPVELLTGNFFYNQTRHDIRLPDEGPTLELLFSYHSQDRYNGPFGYGWHSTLTSMAVEVTDGQEHHVIIRQGNGRRKRYLLNADGTFQDPVGIYHRLVKNADGTYTLTFKGGTVHQYGTDGRIVRIEGVDQRAVVIAYDDTGAIASATTAGGRTLAFTKGANGKIMTVNDPMVGDYAFAYDMNSNLTSVTDPLGNVTQYAYDDDHNMTSITAPNGVTEVENVYDLQEDRVSQQTLLQGQVQFSYDSATRTRVTDPRGTTTHDFNAAGLPTVTTFFDGTMTTRVWDTNLNLTSFTDTDDNTTTFDYDTRGNLTQLTEPSGQVTTFAYETTFDRVVSVTDVDQGTTATISYDDAQELIGITDVMGGGQTFPADTFGLLRTDLRALGKVFPFTSRYQLRP
jgi:YD repeat-containing protein